MTAGQVAFVADPNLQNINLGIGSPAPSSWDQIHLRLDGICEADNLYVTATPVTPTLSLAVGAFGEVKMSWLSETNFSYQIQACQELGSNSWMLWPIVPGTGLRMSFTDDANAHMQMFFRVLVLPQ